MLARDVMVSQVVTVKPSAADLWGVARTDAERSALRVAAESLQGVRTVNDHLVIRPW